MRNFTIFSFLSILAFLSVGAAVLLPQGKIKNGEDLSKLAPAAGKSFSNESSIGGAFTLTDQHGMAVTERSLLGHYSLVTFGYSYCPDICPATLTLLSGVLNQLGPLGDKVTPIFITVDPARDTAPVLADYAAHFTPRLVALTGSAAQIRQAITAFKVYAESHQKNADDHDYMVDHSAYIYLMGPNGAYVTHFPYTMPQADMVRELTPLLKELPESPDR